MREPRVPIEIDIPQHLARWERADTPVVSVYADWTVSGRGRHEAPTVVEHHLRDALSLLPERGAAHASLSADVARVQAFLAERVPPAACSVVIFACEARGLWYARTLGIPTSTAVHVGDYPQLLQLAELTQDATDCIIAVVDTEHVRLIDLADSGARELTGLSEDTWGGTRGSSRAAWRNAQRMRAHETTLHHFAAEAAQVIAHAVEDEGLQHLAIAGDDGIVPLVRDALPLSVRNRIVATIRVDMRAGLSEVVDLVWPDVRAAAAAARASEVGSLLDRAGDTEDIATRAEAVRPLLASGRVETLVLDPQAFPGVEGEAMLREAIAHRCRILLVREHSGLTSAGGVVVSLH